MLFIFQHFVPLNKTNQYSFLIRTVLVFSLVNSYIFSSTIVTPISPSPKEPRRKDNT